MNSKTVCDLVFNKNKNLLYDNILVQYIHDFSGPSERLTGPLLMVLKIDGDGFFLSDFAPNLRFSA